MNTYRIDFMDRDALRVSAELRAADQDWQHEHPILLKPRFLRRLARRA